MRNYIADVIKKERLARGWSFDDFSIMTGLNRANLHQIENGKVNVSIDTLEKILKPLKLSLKIEGQNEGQNNVI